MAAEVEPVYQAIGLRIRMIRDTLDIQQEDLAKRIGCTRSSIASIETGRERLLMHRLEKIAKALGTTPKGLLRGIWF